MKNNRLWGGIGLLILATFIFLFAETAVPIPIALTVIGVALIAASRKRNHRWQS